MLTIRTLGHVSIDLDNRPLYFETRTVSALLIYLACQRRSLSREALAEFFWPERTQKQAHANLRVALHRLRQQVADYLLLTQSSVALNPAATIIVDAAHFEMQLSGSNLSEATARYSGGFLADFYLDSSPAFEQWALLERERLHTRALSAYQQLVDQRSAAGQFAVATSAAQRLLQLDPLHEPTHRQLMRLLAQAGQRSAALAQYETCRNLLSNELAVLPDEATTRLAEQIRSGELEWETRRQGDKVISSPPHLVTLSPLRNLPSQPTPFIGRSSELAQIVQLLANPDCRLLTLLGVGGIGKTRLAIEAAQSIFDSAGTLSSTLPFPDGVCFVPLAAVEADELVIVTIAQALGISTNSSDLATEIVDYLRPRQLLLVLDNLEHLLTATDALLYLLQHAPQLKVLVTSRQRLHLREEWLLPVSGLPITDDSVIGDGLDTTVAGEAGALFLHSTQRVQPAFLAQGQEKAIATICQLVEGMPLALELAASWVRVMPCAEIARLIQTDIDFLTTPLRNLPERHRSMRALFDQSWRLLSPLEQGVLMRLSVFRGGWQLAEASAVTGATLALMLGLVDKSLVRANGEQRFDLHELVRQYAVEQLVASGEGEMIRQRHYDAYLQLFRTGDGYLRGPEAPTWVTRLEAEQDNLRAALQWTIDTAKYTDTAWLLIAVNWFWEQSGFYDEARRWYTQLLPHRQALATDLRLAILVSHNPLVNRLKVAQTIERYWDEIMVLQEVSSMDVLRSAAWVFYAVQAADSTQAAVALQKAIAFARVASEAPADSPEFCFFTDRDFILGTTLRIYASCLIDLGNVIAAADFAKESFEFFQSRGNRFERVGGLGVWGKLAFFQGNLVQARENLLEVVDVITMVNEQEALSDWKPLLSLITLYSGDVLGAQRLLEECMQLCLKMQSHVVSAVVCAYLAETALWQGELDQAEHWLTQSLLQVAQPTRITFNEVQRRWVAARLATAQQQYQRAATLFGFAEHAHSQIHHVIGGPMRALVDAALVTVQAEMEPAIFAEAFTAGQRMTLKDALLITNGI